MTAPSVRRTRRQRGSIEELPSGALRVSVYAGTDPLTGRCRYLRESIPAGPSARLEAQKAMRRLATEVDERRNPRTNATVDQLLDQHFELAELEVNTLANYRSLAEKHIRPLIGSVKVGALDGALFDSFYATLRRCRDHCDRRPRVDHRTEGPHHCDDRCKPHQCRPLSNGRLVKRLGIATTIHKLRHYSATELISAGVDVRTVAGRLGHGGGGTTTLKVYAAWVSESDQRAATSLFARLPARPDANPTAVHEGATPYQRVAAKLRAQIASGELPISSALLTHKQLAQQYGIAASTAHRVTALLSSEGLVEVSRGRRAIVVRQSAVDADQGSRTADDVATCVLPDGHQQSGSASVSC